MATFSNPQKGIDYIADTAGQPDGEEEEQEDEGKYRNPVCYAEGNEAE